VTVATTIVNARVFDGLGAREWTSLRFADGVITECSDVAASRSGDVVVDAAGGSVIPGLIDAHVHLVPGALERSANAGVTTVLDMFSTADVVAAARERAARSTVADLRSSGVGATAPGGHPSSMYPSIPTLTAPDQAERFVERRIAEGSDYLKIISGTTGIWPALDAATITALVVAAHSRGLVVVAHVSSVAGLDEVVDAGVDVVAHVPVDAELDDELIARISDAGIAVCPTLVTLESTLGGTRAPAYSRAERAVGRLAAAGVVLLAGTDAPNPGTAFGDGLHRELELLVRSGLEPAGAVAAATSAPARVFGLADRGRVAVGMRADLLLVSGDPATDIRATRSIERIWRAGSVVDRRPFVPDAAEAEQLAAFEARVAAAVAAVRARRPGRGPRTSH
jgi:imidazolonepropionase-like amidohydrolase